MYTSGSCSSFPNDALYLYFPTGVYLVSGQINPCGPRWAFFGAGPQSSIIRLKPNSAAFNTGTNTRWFNPTSINNNDNFQEFIFNLGFDVGYGNPNAIPFTTEQNNVGVERNVIIWSEDGNCPYAFNIGQEYPGPALSKNVALYGCVNAVYSSQVEYSWTFDQMTTEGQTGTVIVSGPLKIAIQHWLSDNKGTALANSSAGGISVIDSELLNGAGSTTGITNASGGSVFARNVTITGYSPSEIDSGTGTPVTYTGNLTQNWTGTAQSLWNSAQAPSSLYLPEEETPLPTDDPTQSDWTVLSSNIANWCSEIIASRSVTVYAPPGTYATGTGAYNCTIPDTVNHLQFYVSMTPALAAMPQITLTVAGVSTTPLVIDGCVYSTCGIVHTGTRTVVVNDTTIANYSPSVGAGNAFFEDDTIGDEPVMFQPGQSIWARQLDLESQNQTGNHFSCNLSNALRQASTRAVI
jgi:hypothetical protein